MSLPPPVHCWVVLRQPLSAGNVVFKTMEIKGLQSCTHSQKFEGKAAMADFKLCSHGAHNHFSQCSYFSIFISDYWFVVSFFFFRHSFQILLWRPVIRTVSSESYTSCSKQNKVDERGMKVNWDYLCKGGLRNETDHFNVNLTFSH